MVVDQHRLIVLAQHPLGKHGAILTSFSRSPQARSGLHACPTCLQAAQKTAVMAYQRSEQADGHACPRPIILRGLGLKDAAHTVRAWWKKMRRSLAEVPRLTIAIKPLSSIHRDFPTLVSPRLALCHPRHRLLSSISPRNTIGASRH